MTAFLRDWTETAPVEALWAIWLAYWFIAARGTKPTQRQESLGSRLTHLVPLAIGAVLMLSPRLPLGWLNDLFLPHGLAIYWLGVATVAAGLGFMVWARRRLGANWSGRVTLKQDHELIRSGPYGLVRHPIYSGLLLAMFGTAIAFGQWRDALAFLFFAVAVWRKSRIEEAYLAELFPEEYPAYQAEVPALFPLLFPHHRPPPAGSPPS